MTADDQYKPVFVEVASLTKGDTFVSDFLYIIKGWRRRPKAAAGFIKHLTTV